MGKRGSIPDSSTLLRLSIIFDVSIDELLIGKKLTKEMRISDIHNSITLSAVDEINRKLKRIKKIKIEYYSYFVIFPYCLSRLLFY